MLVVIPSNRNVNFDYLRPLIDAGARFIVVDDTPGSIRIDHPAFAVYNWEDRRRILGELDASFPRRNGACRDFGFFIAWREADNDEIIVALDDDCEVMRADFATAVEAALSPATHAYWKGAGRHANILDLYDNTPPDLFPRGFPYEERIGYRPREIEGTLSGRSAFNLGLWTDAFDVNGIDKISGPGWRHPEARLRHASVAVPPGTLISVCSMNMQFRRALVPAVYQFPMHFEVMPHWVIDRYGDIWGGFALKLLMDRCGDLMTVGGPVIAHRKPGDQLRNTWQEHLCHLVNREFIDLLVAASGEVRHSNYLDMMGDLREGIARRAAAVSPLLRSYAAFLTTALESWCVALDRAERSRRVA